MDTSLKAGLAAALTSILVGAAMVSTKLVANVIPSAELAFLRYPQHICWRFHFLEFCNLQF